MVMAYIAGALFFRRFTHHGTLTLGRVSEQGAVVFAGPSSSFMKAVTALTHCAVNDGRTTNP
jgi:hypothetical protein